jgi:ATP-dependent DNA helicase RecG
VLNRLIVEATECDFKRELEKKKPKSWLKSVSAFANGIGGSLFYGVEDDSTIVGLADAQADAEYISAKIKERISPVPEFILTPYNVDGKTILVLEVKRGRNVSYGSSRLQCHQWKEVQSHLNLPEYNLCSSFSNRICHQIHTKK